MRIFICDAHGDDSFLTMGGTINKHIRHGDFVMIMAFSKCQKSTPEGFDKDFIEKELKQACSVISPKITLTHFDYPVREFNSYRQQILETIFPLRNLFDVVYVPSTNDMHQDHQVVCNEAIRAFKNRATILGYYHPHNCLSMNQSYYNELSNEDVAAKLRALSGFESQQNRPEFNPDYIRGLAIIAGSNIGAGYAEMFEAIRIINRNS